MADEVVQVKTKKRKIIDIVGYSLVGVLGAVALAFLIVTIVFKSKGKCLSFGNTEIRVVLTGSMEWNEKTDPADKQYEIKNIDINDAVYIDKKPTDETKLKETYDSYKVGDVLTFYYVTNGQRVVITHRIDSKNTFSDGYVFGLQGDNQEGGTPGTQYIYTSTNNPNPLNEIIGKVYKVNSSLGGFLTAISSKTGIICLVIVPAGLIFIYESYKLISFLVKEKKATQKVKLDSKDEEIEKLKAQLKEMEAKNKENKGGSES